MKAPNYSRRWGVILAGGDGKRLRPLTRLIAGDDRPKQFCPLFEGERTLLDQTRLRTANIVPPSQTLYVLTDQHKPFFAADLAQVCRSRMIVQPENRGTLPAILSSLVRMAQLEGAGWNSETVVAFFPSDHYYAREKRFIKGLLNAFNTAERNPNSVILLGADAKTPESGFGYIEAAPMPEDATDPQLKSVARFWEKPTPEVAQSLMNRGCVWNTFVMVGRVSAFLGLIQESAPDLYRAFEPMLSDAPADDFTPVYDSIPSADFSKMVLSSGNPRLTVLNLGDVGWSDLGDPQRVIDTLSTHGIRSPWHQLWVREMGIAPVVSA